MIEASSRLNDTRGIGQFFQEILLQKKKKEILLQMEAEKQDNNSGDCGVKMSFRSFSKNFKWKK